MYLRPFIAVVVLSAGVQVLGQDAKRAGNAERLFAAGQALQQAAAATAATDPDARDLVTRNYQAAINRYAEAVKLKPDLHRAHAAWAQCLLRLARLETNRERRRETLIKAHEQFRLATRSREVEWTLWNEWAQTWMLDMEDTATSAAQRLAALREAAQLYEKALDGTSFSGDRARVECDLGICFLQAARNTDEAGHKRTFYEQCILRFESASKVEAQARKAGFYGVWGVALVELGRLDGDRMILRQAIDRLNTAVERDADSPETQYNLACAYALLNQPDPAMRHLRLCFEHDPKHTFFNSAVQDRDFDSLRIRRDFNDLLSDTQSTGTNAATSPSIFDR